MAVVENNTAVQGEGSTGKALLPSGESFPVLKALLSGENADALTEELERLIALKTRAVTTRAVRLKKNLFARLRSLDGDQCEVGVVRDISRSGVRVKFLRNSSLDIIKNHRVVIETRLPSDDMVSLEARMVRVAHSTELHIELAFHFEPGVPEQVDFQRLLQAIEHPQ